MTKKFNVVRYTEEPICPACDASLDFDFNDDYIDRMNDAIVHRGAVWRCPSCCRRWLVNEE